jgi:molybdopterin synthase sulfur carrier subunit
MIKLVYFARLREALGCGTEQLALPADVRDVDGLRRHLRMRGGAWQAELAPGNPVRAAVNQDIAHGATPVADGDEVAFFPPVTGG